jgi:TonB-dependent SusC/RagA subfamily outer membrane receptor
VPKTDSSLAVNTITDSKRHFVFSFPQLYGEQQFTIIGAGPGGSKDVKITLDDQSMPPVKIPVAPAFQSESIDKRLNSYLAVQQQFYTGPKTRQLKEVVIKGKQLTLEEKALEASSNLNGAGNADQVITYKDLGYCKDLEQCLQGKLTGVFFKLILDAFSNTYKKVPFSSGANKPMLIVRDGIPMPPGQSFLVDVPAGDVQSVEVLRTGARASIYGMQASGGAIIITTKRGGINYNAMYESKPLAPGFLAVTYNGYNKSREFYTPPVNAQNPKISTAETLYWNTRVKTNDDGQAIIEFAPGTNVKKIAITVEGLSAEGKTGYLYQEETL